MRKISLTNLAQSGGIAAIPTVSTNYDITADMVEVLSVQVIWGSTTASFSYQLQSSNDGSNWTNLGSAQSIANNSGSTHTQVKGVVDAGYYRLALTKTSGTLTTFKVNVASQPRN